MPQFYNRESKSVTGETIYTSGFETDAELAAFNAAEAKKNAPDVTIDVSEVKKTAANGFGTGIDAQIAAAKTAADKVIDQDEIRRVAVSEFQDQIDYQTAFYDSLIATARAEGQQRLTSSLGKSRSLRASRGILGTARGSAQQDSVQSFEEGKTADEVATINAQKNSVIAGLLGEARDLASDRLGEERAAKQAGSDSFLAFLEKKEATNKANAQTIIAASVAQGITFDDLEPTEVSDLATQFGLTVKDFETIYRGASAEAGAADLAGTSQDFRTFKALEASDGLPAGVTTFDQYVRAIKAAGSAPSGGGNTVVDSFKFTSSQSGKLVGAGISTQDIGLIQQSLNENGVEATLAAIDNPEQRAAVAEQIDGFEALGRVEEQEEIATRTVGELVSDVVDTATPDQLKKLKKLADTAGVSSLWTGKKTDIKRLLDTPEMQAVLESANERGLTTDEIIDALTK